MIRVFLKPTQELLTVMGNDFVPQRNTLLDLDGTIYVVKRIVYMASSRDELYPFSDIKHVDVFVRPLPQRGT